MTPLSWRPAPAASRLFYERLASDPTLCQKKVHGFLPFGPSSVMSPLFAEIIAAATGYEWSNRTYLHQARCQ